MVGAVLATRCARSFGIATYTTTSSGDRSGLRSTDSTSTSRASTTSSGSGAAVPDGWVVRAIRSTRSPGRSTAAVAGSANCTGTPTSPDGTGSAARRSPADAPDGESDGASDGPDGLAAEPARQPASVAEPSGGSTNRTPAASVNSAATTAYRSRDRSRGGRNRTGSSRCASRIWRLLPWWQRGDVRQHACGQATSATPNCGQRGCLWTSLRSGRESATPPRGSGREARVARLGSRGHGSRAGGQPRENDRTLSY